MQKDNLQGVVTTTPQAMNQLPKKVIETIGYTKEDLLRIRNVYCQTLDEYRKHPIEKVSVSFKQSMHFRRLDKSWFQAKKGVKYILTLPEVIRLYQDPNLAQITEVHNGVQKNFNRYEGQDLTGKHMLMWMDGGIGDTLFYKTIVDAIKRRYPTSMISCAAAGWFHSMCNRWRSFYKVYDIPFTYRAFMNYDYHLNFDGVIVRVRDAEETNVYEHLCNWIKMDIPVEELYPTQNVPYKELKKAKNKLRNWGHLDNFIIVNTESRSKVRTIGPDQTLKLYNKLLQLGFNIVLLDFKNKWQHHETIINQTIAPDRMFNYCKYIEDIDDSVALISLAKMMVSVDTANNHIACSVGTPIFGLFGPFEGFLRLKTYPKTKWIDLPCELGACHSHAVGDNTCINPAPHGYPKCYDLHDIDYLGWKILEHYNKFST